MVYRVSPGRLIPELQLVEVAPKSALSIFLHEVNARMPGIMSATTGQWY